MTKPGERAGVVDEVERDTRLAPRSSGAATMPEDIPPVHVLEAAQSQELKEAEELLAGFDRPGRSPRRSQPSRDFVDYYAGREIPRTPSPGAVALGVDAEKRRAAQVSTQKRNHARPIPGVVRSRAGWLIAGVLLVGLASFAAFFATTRATSEAKPEGSLAAPVTPSMEPAQAHAQAQSAQPTEPPHRSVVPPPVDVSPSTTEGAHANVRNAEDRGPGPTAKPPGGRASSEPTNAKRSPTTEGAHEPPPPSDFARSL